MTGPNPPFRRDARSYLATLGQASGLESAGEHTESALKAAADLASSGARQKRLDRLERSFAKADRGGTADGATMRARASVMRQAEDALSKLGREPGDVELTADDYVGLEAVVRPTERPSLLVHGGDVEVDLTDPDLGPWQGVMVLAREQMKATIASVGRIDLGSAHVGTGFVVAPGVVMTNRHVLQEIAVESPAGGGKTKWTLISSPTIDFLREYDTEATAEFAITDVVFAGPTRILSHSMDIGKLDLALVAVETTNEAGHPLPKPLPIRKSSASSTASGELFMVGYPARPQTVAPGGTGEHDVADILRRVFNMKYGFKRLALGTISLPLGKVTGDTKGWVMGHDATTLGGNSGSCVAAVNDGGPILGLHFGGYEFDYNLAHVLPAVPDLRADPVTGLGLTWK